MNRFGNCFIDDARRYTQLSGRIFHWYSFAPTILQHCILVIIWWPNICPRTVYTTVRCPSGWNSLIFSGRDTRVLLNYAVRFTINDRQNVCDYPDEGPCTCEQREGRGAASSRSILCNFSWRDWSSNTPFSYLDFASRPLEQYAGTYCCTLSREEWDRTAKNYLWYTRMGEDDSDGSKDGHKVHKRSYSSHRQGYVVPKVFQLFFSFYRTCKRIDEVQLEMCRLNYWSPRYVTDTLIDTWARSVVSSVQTAGNINHEMTFLLRVADHWIRKNFTRS